MGTIISELGAVFRKRRVGLFIPRDGYGGAKGQPWKNRELLRVRQSSLLYQRALIVRGAQGLLGRQIVCRPHHQ